MLSNLPLYRATPRSKKATPFLLDSYVNWILELKTLKSALNYSRFSSPRVQIKKISSMYLNHAIGWWLWVLKNSVSIWSMKIQTYGGASFVLIAVPDICWKTSLLNSKKLFFSTNWVILTSLSLEICLWFLSSSASSSAGSPASCGMLGLKPTTPAVTVIIQPAYNHTV